MSLEPGVSLLPLACCVILLGGLVCAAVWAYDTWRAASCKHRQEMVTLFLWVLVPFTAEPLHVYEIKSVRPPRCFQPAVCRYLWSSWLGIGVSVGSARILTFVRDEGAWVVAKFAKEKTYKNGKVVRWDIGAAGAITAGASPREQALQEMAEEFSPQFARAASKKLTPLPTYSQYHGFTCLQFTFLFTLTLDEYRQLLVASEPLSPDKTFSRLCTQNRDQIQELDGTQGVQSDPLRLIKHFAPIS